MFPEGKYAFLIQLYFHGSCVSSCQNTIKTAKRGWKPQGQPQAAEESKTNIKCQTDTASIICELYAHSISSWTAQAPSARLSARLPHRLWGDCVKKRCYETTLCSQERERERKRFYEQTWNIHVKGSRSSLLKCQTSQSACFQTHSLTFGSVWLWLVKLVDACEESMAGGEAYICVCAEKSLSHMSSPKTPSHKNSLKQEKSQIRSRSRTMFGDCLTFTWTLVLESFPTQTAASVSHDLTGALRVIGETVPQIGESHLVMQANEWTK